MVKIKKGKSTKKYPVQKLTGSHYLIDFFGCDIVQLNDMKFWKEHLPKAADVAGMEILKSDFHQFEPFGITGFLLLSTSHISFHTWPEYNYVACDVFSCGSDENTKKAVVSLMEKLSYTHYIMKKINRGYVIL